MRKNRQKMGKKHLIVISVDALVYEDIKDTSELPVFGKMISGGSLIKNVLTIYPSLTHPVHASIITGQPAGVTGITANTVFTPGDADMPWYNRLSEIRCETIFDLAHRAGLTSAACRWPVTANAGDKIDYLIPELMSKDLEAADGNALKGYLKTGMSPCLESIMEEALKKYGSSLSHPVYDEVQIECACELIRRYKPDMLFTHPGYVDSERHRTGLFSPFVAESVKRSDEWTGRLMQAAKDAGIYDDTDFIVLSDHGHLSYSRIVRLNAVLAEEGFISVDGSGAVKDWSVYAQSCDLSAQIYLKDPEDAELKKRIGELLVKWADEKKFGIESVMDREEADLQYGLRGDFVYVLEAVEGYHFSDEWMGEIISDVQPVREGLGHSAHGHRPEKGPQPVFIGFGPDFTPGKVTDDGNVLEYFQMFRNILGC